jgi:hypothetical protein
VAVLVMEGEMERQAEGDEGHRQGEPLDDAALARKQSDDHGPYQGHQERQRQYRIVQQDRLFVSLLEVHGKAEISNSEQRRGADRQPTGVRTDIAGLHTLHQGANAAHASCCEAAASIYQSAIDYARQNVPGHKHKRHHDGYVIELVPSLVIKNRGTIRNAYAICEQPSGRRLLALANIFPIRNHHDEVIGAVNIIRHNTGQAFPGLHTHS